MKENEEDHDPAPTPRDAVQIPGYFVWQIARPDHEQLRKRHVGPHHGEREQKASQMLKVLFPDDLREGCARREPGEEQEDESQAAQHLSDADQDRENGREPIRLE